jgi:DNA-binding MarR family transcriptional regulator
MRITDPRTIRALAHPLRLDLLEALAVSGPATAASCGQWIGASQASCSFHLRQLEKYGFVERAPGGPDARERPWRLVDLEQEWSARELDPATDQLDRVLIQREADRTLSWVTNRQAESTEWRTAAFVGGATIPLTAGELSTIGEGLRGVLQPYIDRMTDSAGVPAEARPARISLAGIPLSPAASAR